MPKKPADDRMNKLWSAVLAALLLLAVLAVSFFTILNAVTMVRLQNQLMLTAKRIDALEAKTGCLGNRPSPNIKP